MRTTTKEMLVAAMCNDQKVAKRLSMIATEEQIDMLASGVIVGATIKEEHIDDVLKEFYGKKDKNPKIVCVEGKDVRVRVYIEYKESNGDEIEVKKDDRCFNVCEHPRYEEWFYLELV